MKAVLLLLLIFGAVQGYAQQTQVQKQYTVTRTINFGYRHNQDNLINSFREQAPLEYEKTWNYIIQKLGLDEGVEFEDVKGFAGREARIILVRTALDYFSSKGN